MIGMKFDNGNGCEIIIEQIYGFGKKPGLWIKVKDNARIKLASFGSEEKAEMFVEYMIKFLELESKTHEIYLPLE